jgi:hypothetical protein
MSYRRRYVATGWSDRRAAASNLALGPDGDERQAALLAPGEKLAAGRAYVRRVCGLRMLAVNAAVVAAAVISEATAEQKY